MLPTSLLEKVKWTIWIETKIFIVWYFSPLFFFIKLPLPLLAFKPPHEKVPQLKEKRGNTLAGIALCIDAYCLSGGGRHSGWDPSGQFPLTIRQFEPMWTLSIWTISFGQCGYWFFWSSVPLVCTLCTVSYWRKLLFRISRVFRLQSRTRWTSSEMTTEVNKRIKLSNKQHRPFALTGDFCLPKKCIWTSELNVIRLI